MNRGRILVIDDNRNTARQLGQVLQPRFGYQTMQAFDGRTGLDLIRQDTPDLVMLELDLPDLSGLEFLAILRKESHSVPIILMTARGSEKNVADGFRLGIADYLVKPFNEEELVTALYRAVPELVRKSVQAKEASRQEEKSAAAPAQSETPSPAGGEDRVGKNLHRQLSQIKALFGIGKAVTALLSVEQILDRVLDAATYLTDAEESVVWLPESKTGMLRAYARKSGTDDKQILSLSMRDSQIAHVMRTGRPQRLNSDGGQVKLQTGYLARALMTVPLPVKGNVVGALSVINRLTDRGFSERDEYLLTSLGDYAAIALHNARLYYTTDRALAARADELRTLVEITRQITSTLELDEIVHRTLRQVHDSWQVESSALWLLEEGRAALRLMDAVGTDAKRPSEQVPLGRGIVGYVAQSGESVSTNDAVRHPFYEKSIDEAVGTPLKTLLCIPLHFRNNVIGVLQLTNKKDGSFSDTDLEWGESLGAAVAIALRNALNYNWMTEQHDELEGRLSSIRVTALELKRTGKFDREADELLSEIIRESTQLSGLTTGMLMLPEPPLE